MSTALTPLLSKFATRYETGLAPSDVLHTLKQTCFKGPVNDAQMAALLIVADQYKLNPWTKEIYAFPDKNNGIVPVVGVDGWSRIINEHPAFDGMEFDMAADGSECTCRIYRKDRSHPISVTEYMAECKRNVGPWQSHPRRMLRHKAMIQCARLAFGFAGIFDQDEAERIVLAEKDITPTKPADFVEQAGQKEDSPEVVAAIMELQELAFTGEPSKVQAKFQSLDIEIRRGIGESRWDSIKKATTAAKNAKTIDGEAQEVASDDNSAK